MTHLLADSLIISKSLKCLNYNEITGQKQRYYYYYYFIQGSSTLQWFSFTQN
jgi:hypothetical protein